MTERVLFHRNPFHRERPGLPDNWQEILSTRSVQWNLLDEDERTRLGEFADWILTEHKWEAGQGFEITDEVRTLVSAHAALLILELDESWYHDVGTVIIRDGAMDRGGALGASGMNGIVTRTAGMIEGEAQHGDGPVMLAWDAAVREAANPRWGRDVVLHEFSHKLDMLDGTADGTPGIEDEATRATWVKICTYYFNAVRLGTGPRILRDYAGTNAAEFFAVATEVFFTRPLDVAQQTPDLYDILRDFYGQDPGERLQRAIHAGAHTPPPPMRVVARHTRPKTQDA